jgi:Lrp/AsnC family transcriptional regulator of ectoine degradation
MLRLDDRDLKILSILSRNGRITKSELVGRAGMGTTACADRLARLESSGVISGYVAQMSLRRGSGQNMGVMQRVCCF